MRFHQTFDESPLESLVGEIEERDEMIVELDGLITSQLNIVLSYIDAILGRICRSQVWIGSLPTETKEAGPPTAEGSPPGGRVPLNVCGGAA